MNQSSVRVITLISSYDFPGRPLGYSRLTGWVRVVLERVKSSGVPTNDLLSKPKELQVDVAVDKCCLWIF